MTVHAIVLARPDRLEAATAAVRAEEPDDLTAVAVAAGDSPSAVIRAEVERGVAAGPEWLWVLEDVVPQPGALRALLDWMAAHPEARPALLASRVEDPDGRLRFFREWPDYGDLDAVIAGAHMQALVLRAASFHGLLLSTEAIRRHGLPIAGDAGWRPEWEFTGRLLREERGWLVPASVVRLSDAAHAPDPVTDLRNALWTARSRAWGPRERFDRHVQWAVGALRSADRRAALPALRAGLRRAPR